MGNPETLDPDDENLLDVAVAIADGTPVEWSQAAGTAATGAGSMAARLRQVERIVRGHGALHEPVQQGPAVRVSSEETLLAQARREGRHSGDPVRVEWGPLVVLDKIGRGSFGDVYRAWDPRLQREVALKLLRETPAHLSQPAFEEGRLLARVRHPNVITVYGAERIDGRVGIWMEYVRGRTLADEVAAQGPMKLLEAARVGVEVCRALSAVHRAGLLHRDVKAHNVMRDEHGRIVLGDFGTGVEFDESAGVAEPQIAGTPLYLAPEIFDHGQASVATDIYSVGVLLYFLTTGQYPVSGRTFGEVRRAHRAGARTPLRVAQPNLPSGFVEIVDALLEPGPDRRYGSAASAEAGLVAWIADQTSPEALVNGHRAPRRALWLFSGAAAAGALLVTLGLSIWRDGGWPGRAAGPGASMPVSRQIVDPPCSGSPGANGWIACVETFLHLRERGAAPPPPLVLFNPETRESRILRSVQPPERITSAALSPDGARVAFVLEAPGRPAEVRTIGAMGQVERLVLTAPADIGIIALAGWSSHDGRLEARLLRSAAPQALGLISPENGALELAHEFGVPPQTFRRSAGGDLLVFDTQQEGRPERDIRICSLSTDACETLVAHPANDFAPQWAPDGRLLFVSDRAGTMGLWAVELSGLGQAGAPELITDTGRARLSPLGFGPDGSFFYDLWVGEFDIYSAVLFKPSGQPPIPVRLSPRAVDRNRSPVFSPDGRSLAYVSQRGPYSEQGSVRVVIQSLAEGTEREFRYDVRFNMTRLAWSPDGSLLAMRTLKDGVPPNGIFGVHLISTASGEITKTLRRREPLERYIEEQITDIAWLDREAILFASQRGLRVFDVASGEDRPVWDAPAGTILHGMALSPDRGWAAVVTSDVAMSWFAAGIVAAVGGSARELLRVKKPEGMWMQAWSASGDSVLVTRWDASAPLIARRSQLWRLAADGGAAEPLPLALAGLAELSVHPDGTRIAFSAGAPRSEFWVMSSLTRR